MSWPGVNPLIFREKEKDSREIMCAFAVLEVGSRNVALAWSGRLIRLLGALGDGVSHPPERLKS